MSKAPIQKKFKQTNIQSAFQQAHKKKNTRHSEPGETSQASDNVQETMAHTLKTEAEEGPSNLQQGAEEQEYNFWFSSDFNPRSVFVSGYISMTVLDALKTCDTFSVNKNINDVKKEIVILRADGAAVKKDFPCCLIKKDENLKIIFINKGKNAFTVEEKQERLLPPRTGLVTFYIETAGKKNMKHIMKNKELTEQADNVCVYAFRGEDVETALKRDGRFIDTIFQKLCLLTLKSKEGANKNGSSKNYEMSDRVDHLHKKTFQIVATGDKRPDIQKKPIKVKTESDVASAADSAQNDPGQHPIGTGQNTIQERETNSAGPSALGPATQNTSRIISGNSGKSFSTDIEEFLQSLCEDVLKKLKQRKKSRDQKFVQEEYDKGVQCFTEVNKVRKIMDLSDSVCLIKIEDSSHGTGFLVFNRFILTNAHVVKDCVYSSPERPHTIKLSKTLTAVFNYEVSGSAAKVLSVKDDVVAYGYETNDRRRFHDFALLELEAAPDNCTELFERYNHASPPNRGGIYIVGHPNGEVKKMDPCFIIGSENQLQSINKHISENISCPYMSWGCWQYLHHNRITYDSCFFHGSSGSPVFDEHCCLIGIHSGGFHYEEKKRDRSVIEFAYSMPSIIEAIVTQVKKRSDILKLLSKCKTIRENFDLSPLEDTCGTNMPVNEEQQRDEDEKMEVDA